LRKNVFAKDEEVFFRRKNRKKKPALQDWKADQAFIKQKMNGAMGLEILILIINKQYIKT